MSVELSFQQEFALIVINRPDSLNALNFVLLDDIAAAIDQVGNSEARALIVTGAGERAFSAGADITELVDRPLAAQREGALRGQAAFAGLDRLRVPSVALVNGYAFGGGAELALACTFRLATANAKFGLPEIKLALIPGYGGTQRLPRLIGQARAMELILTGRTVAAEEALAIGLVNRLVKAPALDAAFTFAREFTGHSLMALQFARDAVRRGSETSLAEGLKIEADLSTLAYRTADADEGMRAFLDKRSPRFEDR
jgi:enoyl-CoA hydratase